MKKHQLEEQYKNCLQNDMNLDEDDNDYLSSKKNMQEKFKILKQIEKNSQVMNFFGEIKMVLGIDKIPIGNAEESENEENDRNFAGSKIKREDFFSYQISQINKDAKGQEKQDLSTLFDIRCTQDQVKGSLPEEDFLGISDLKNEQSSNQILRPGMIVPTF
mmetsp:Transcript_16570/g.28201  ORF Transcript_16570/g.28201 Transcript_16570/m.28201 type:complete len:161 (+) Transcript_16570:660-1142(+)